MLLDTLKHFFYNQELCKGGDRQLLCQTKVAASSFMPADVYRVPAVPRMYVISNKTLLQCCCKPWEKLL